MLAVIHGSCVFNCVPGLLLLVTFLAMPPKWVRDFAEPMGGAVHRLPSPSATSATSATNAGPKGLKSKKAKKSSIQQSEVDVRLVALSTAW